jgi:hypothetical protein
MIHESSDDLWAVARTILAQYAEATERFRQAAAAVLSRLAEGRPPPTRRPPISLQLMAAGLPAAKLSMVPHWTPPCRRSGRPGVLDCERLRVEMLTEEAVRHEGTDTRKFTCRAALLLLPGGKSTLRSFYRSTFRDDLHRAVGVMTDFLADSRTVFARSHDRCCLCRRRLTDEQSRGRGVGPECIRSLDMVLFVGRENSLVVPAGWSCDA